MADRSKSVVGALDGIRDALAAISGGHLSPGSPGNLGSFEYPALANGPVEQVIAFNNNEHIVLENFPENAYFSSHGPLTDLHGNVVPGTRVATTFPVSFDLIAGGLLWPHTQSTPFDAPPVDNTNTTNHGYSKQAYYFNNDKDWFVTVGPSLPKIVRTTGGGAQFWVGSIGVIAQGAGKYEGARGVTTYVGSGYFDYWPPDDQLQEQAQILQTGFKALVGTYVKVVLAANAAS